MPDPNSNETTETPDSTEEETTQTQEEIEANEEFDAIVEFMPSLVPEKD